MTVVAIVVFIGVLYLCGFGLTLFLFSFNELPKRLMLMPVIGLCAHILLSFFLAQFLLTGKTISTIILPVFAALAVLGWRRSRISSGELRMALPGVLIGLFSVVLVGWPLIYRGMEDYWGLGNPDEGFLIPVLEWIYTHAIGIPPAYVKEFSYLEAYRDIPEATVIGVFYVTSTVSRLTNVPIGLLFNVSALGLIYLTPGGVYALSHSVGLPQKAALTAGFMTACSSLIAYTFYLDSLGATSVIAVVPVACVLAMQFITFPGRRTGFALALACASMFYNYLGALGVIGVLVTAALAYGLVSRAVSIRQALLFVGITVGSTMLMFAPFAASALWFFIRETFGSGRKIVNEITMGFALTLTERGIPFLWGFWIPGATAWPLGWLPATDLVLASLLCLLVFVMYAHPHSRIHGIYTAVLSALTFVVVFYAQSGFGYGVFKLVAWIHPLMVTALVGATFTLSGLLLQQNRRRLSWLPMLLVPVYVVPNVGLTLQLGYTTVYPLNGLSVHQAPLVSFADVRDLRSVAPDWAATGAIATLPDAATAGWANRFVGATGLTFFPYIGLDTVDSVPRPTHFAKGARLLHWSKPNADVTPLPECPVIWSNSSFALSPSEKCHNVLVVGHGWYRMEHGDLGDGSTKRFRWLRKRGELRLINPSPVEQRLRISAVVGPGNPSPLRNVSLFLNGKELERFTIRHAARLQTKPFIAPGPVSQIELVIQESAEALPRAKPLWNRWVPAEARRLNVALDSVALVQIDTTESRSSLRLDSAEWNTSLFNGISPDKWMGVESAILLAAPAVPPKELHITGTVPGGAGLPFPFHLTVILNGIRLTPCEIPRAGAFSIHCPIPTHLFDSAQPRQAVQIKLLAEKTFKPKNDTRELSLRLDSIALGSQAQ